ncbi:glycerophosphodiester phosphodiesterase family protein [Mycoplasma anserisalpingitidis]|uniref:Glycerophosphodiester phosphodiesterase n=1 Tax=Mycoplasma anserisalpingitidis TaxID=519450 RepID=A0A5B8K3Y7_9MOLU|nr:glycerophosphodiester phosphodiesterase family protein [Mycoplasma anserisalpingitidis]QDY88448.1 glycerophosphodiester phosphodiesterase [Mycoplasma anserisalpingitidis]
MKKQLILGHRGYSAVAPENTKLAFDAALMFGFDGVEMDVHQTKDGELVVIHDENTLRTAKEDFKILNTNYEKVENLDYSSFFKTPTPKQKLLTLKEFLDLYAYVETFKMINIEIKTDVIEYENIEQRINDLCLQYPNIEDKLVFSSFNFNSLRKLKKINPKWKLGFLFWKKSQIEEISKQEILDTVDYLHPWAKLYKRNKELISSFRLPLNIWTIKSKKEFKHFKEDKNVLSQISNYKF